MFSHSLLSLVVLASSAAAFAPAGSSTTRSAVRLNVDVAAPEEAAPVMKINGWAADASKPCYGLPGAISPFGFFDPLGFTKDSNEDEVKRLREAEIMHG
eukprot:scaffold109346_cov47-Attheya_sp.AAC.1